MTTGEKRRRPDGRTTSDRGGRPRWTLDTVIDLRKPRAEAGEPPNPSRPDGRYPVTMRERALEVYAITPQHAAVAAVLGIDPETWRVVRDRDDDAAGFAAELARVRERSRVAYLSVIDQAATVNRDWRAAREILRFSWPEDYEPRGFFDLPPAPPDGSEATRGTTDVAVFAMRVRNDPRALDAFHHLLALAPAAPGAADSGPADPAPAGRKAGKKGSRRAAGGEPGGSPGVGGDQPGGTGAGGHGGSKRRVGAL